MSKSKVHVIFLMLIILSFTNVACSKIKDQQTPQNASSQATEPQTPGQNFQNDNQTTANATDNQIQEEMLFTNNNIYGVQSNPSHPSVFTISQPCKITWISTYHYFNKGALPGTIAFKHEDGTVYGPWQTEGKEGQGKVANAYWIAKPNIVIKAGTYTVIDSDPPTWSQNAQSNNCGFVEVKGIKLAP